MKKRVFLSLLLALLLVGTSVCAFAEAQLDFMTDAAEILTEAQRGELNEKARQISEEYSCGVYIVIVEDYRDYVSQGGIEYFAEEVFEEYALGYGSTHDGILLAMSMKERDFGLYAHGDFGNYAFTDYGKSQLANTFLDDFRRNDWAGGFRDYVDKSGSLLRLAKGGKPLDQWIPDTEETGPSMSPVKLLISLIAGCLTGGVTVGSMKGSMKTAVRQTRAENYIAGGGVHLTRKDDQFVNRTVSQHVIRRESSGSRPGGGHYGGTTISGGHGGSHHSGKF